ncbi:MAG: virginiamycin B lyase family protein, partial [Methylocella sp.]
MKQHHISHRFSLFAGLLSLLIFGATLTAALALSGMIIEFPIPTAGSEPVGITAGPDGNLWFTESHGNNIGRITTKGVVTEFPVPTAFSGPGGIAAGPDGNLWFTEESDNQIGTISRTSHAIAEFPTPSTAAGPLGITVGPGSTI